MEWCCPYSSARSKQTPWHCIVKFASEQELSARFAYFESISETNDGVCAISEQRNGKFENKFFTLVTFSDTAVQNTISGIMFQ